MNINKNNLKMLMAIGGLTQEELSNLAKVSRQTISNIFVRGTCHPKTLLKLANALEVEPQELLKTED